ncbi:RNA polymerase factor sigma-54 [Gellertiella hungarica]|uniref:RNA polymerase sigma-54 factor n=1 Tax=Gellertiella hungarica TaxID=1572859 RepID=A0A7W6J2Y4_9HYPH|nr:RNA polymerase factor sigma-54 [Gellertiella hungarica]MBB4063784.1 RNA polymerase sigma-54 factor [Gellertiella hungarica]
MALSASLFQRQSQSLVMTPQLMQSIQLLQMPHAELLQFIGLEVEKNPLLELASGDDGEDDAPEAREDASERTVLNEAGDLSSEWYESENTGAAAGLSREMDANFDDSYAGGEGSGPDAATAPLGEGWTSTGAGGEGFEPDDLGGGPPSLLDHIQAQIPFLFDNARDRLAAEAMAGLLEDSGYVDGAAVEELGARLGLSAADRARILAGLQTLEPPGVFARSLKECLAIQLRQLDRLDPMMETLLDHLDLLAKRDFQSLKRLCKATEEDLLAMLADIRRLNPKPGSGFGGGAAESVVADVIVRPGPHASWLVDLNPATQPRVLINQTYHRRVTAGRLRPDEDQNFLGNCLQSANWLVRSLDQRARTILKVAEEIVRQQDAFLLKGIDHLRPLTLKAVADAIGVHESTVSRVTSNKYMETPRGVFELKYFFTVSIAAVEGGDAHSAEAVRNRIRSLIAEESPAAVLSDDDIVEALGKAGIQLARRTVAKYREAMNIPSSVQRRREKQAKARAGATA